MLREASSMSKRYSVVVTRAARVARRDVIRLGSVACVVTWH
jgi:hypothetical protein